jgi:hypothetical protein
MATTKPLPIPPAFERVSDVAAGFAELEKSFIASKDRRGVFVTAYLLITRTLQEWIDAGRFHQNDIVAQYVVAFANAYRQALAHDEAGQCLAVPQAWRQSFEATRSRNATIIQDLLLGINAHINHDLPHAVIQGGLNVHCERCYQDHTRINDALKLTTPWVRQRIALTYDRSLHLTNWMYGRAIDAAAACSFERARENSWNLAKALDLAQGASDRARVERMIDDRAALAGRMILSHRYAPAKCLAILHEIKTPLTPTTAPASGRFSYRARYLQLASRR